MFPSGGKMEAVITRIKMQLEKLSESLTILQEQVESLEKEAKKTQVDRFDESFSRDKEDFIAP
jgi:hypothetical protein